MASMSPVWKWLPPLAGMTSREGSYCWVHSVISTVLNCPQASLKGIQVTTEGCEWRRSMTACHSFGIGFRFRGSLQFHAIKILAHLPYGRAIAAGHVLPDQHALPVAMQVPAAGSTLTCLRIMLKPSFWWPECHRATPRPKAPCKARPATTPDRACPREVILLFNCSLTIPWASRAAGELAHGKVTLRMIHGLAAAEQRHLQVVEDWAIRGSRAWASRWEIQHLTGDAFGCGQQLARPADFHLGIIARPAFAGEHLHRDSLLIDVRDRLDPGDVTGGHRSIQTVCQIPVTAVYQMPCGLLTCLPRG
jgi:hypothetical protein